MDQEATENPYEAPEAQTLVQEVGGAGGQPLAGRLSRLGAQILNNLIWAALLVPFVLMMDLDPETSEPPDLGLVLLFILGGALLIYQAYLLTTRGQSIGKIIVRVRIVRYEDGTNPGFVKVVLLRIVVNLLIGSVPFLGGFYSLVDTLFIFNQERRCIHDSIAGTKVVEAS